MTDQPRFGNAKLSTVRRDFKRLREAIRLHDSNATEEAWDKCERWLVMDIPAITKGAGE